MNTINRKQIEATYKVEDGIIRNPGKFDGCPIYAPYFYMIWLEDGYDTHEPITILDEDIKEFPELKGYSLVNCWEYEDGFFHCYIHTYETWNQTLEMINADEELLRQAIG